MFLTTSPFLESFEEHHGLAFARTVAGLLIELRTWHRNVVIRPHLLGLSCISTINRVIVGFLHLRLFRLPSEWFAKLTPDLKSLIFLGSSASNPILIKDVAGATVMSLSLVSAGASNPQSTQTAWYSNFTSLSTTGSYYFIDNSNRYSYLFDISTTVYNPVGMAAGPQFGNA
jgi:hypothetical protein